MEKLAKNSFKNGWQYLSPKQCLNRMRQELREAARAVEQIKSEEEVKAECADVANFAMFLSHNYKQERNQPNGKTRKKTETVATDRDSA